MTFLVPFSLWMKVVVAVRMVLETVAVRLEGADLPGLEEVAMTPLSDLEGTSSKITVGVLGTGVDPLQGGSSSSSLGTGVFGSLERWGTLEAFLEQSEAFGIQKRRTRRGVEKEERKENSEENPTLLYLRQYRLAWIFYVSHVSRDEMKVKMSIDVYRGWDDMARMQYVVDIPTEKVRCIIAKPHPPSRK